MLAMREFCLDESGQDLAEYALLLVFIALAAVFALSQMGQSIGGLWDGAFASLQTFLGGS